MINDFKKFIMVLPVLWGTTVNVVILAITLLVKSKLIPIVGSIQYMKREFHNSEPK